MFEEFLIPARPQDISPEALSNPWSWVTRTVFQDEMSPELIPADIALLGVPDFRGTGKGDYATDGPDRIRRALYSLAAGEFPLQVLDLGNIMPGKSEADTQKALQTVLEELYKKDVIPIIIGGSQDLTIAQYEAFLYRQKPMNMVSVDARIDVLDAYNTELEFAWLMKILDREESWLFNFTQLAYQSHYIPPEVINTMDRLHFERLRLGEVREDIRRCEPVVRDTDLLSFDLSCIRASDSPASIAPKPNGLFGEEACQIMRYAGLSSKLSSVGLYGYDPQKDEDGRSADLAAQMIWYFVDGYYNRRIDQPKKGDTNYVKYMIDLEETGHDLTFWKSSRTGRWWLQVPFFDDDQTEHQHLVPCSYEEYEQALHRQEVPDRFIRASNRLG